MGRAKQRADRIRAETSMLDLLVDYGYQVRADGGDREQAFSCDLHGDGRDTRPSAIFYPRSNSFHCFACGRSRDSITLVREKEGLDFWAAIQKIEARFNLPALAWEDDEQRGTKKQSVEQQILGLMNAGESCEATERRLARYLNALSQERSCPPLKLASLWEGFDKVRFLLSSGSLKEEEGIHLYLRILDRAKKQSTQGA